MKHVVIAPVGDNLKALFVGIRDIPTEKVILLAPPNRMKDVVDIKRDLERLSIQFEIIEIRGNPWEGVFQKIAQIKANGDRQNLLINAATGDRSTTCAATSAAFVNGIKAISVEGDEVMALPVLRFSYYRLLSEQKLRLLHAIERKEVKSLEELGRLTRISPPLVSYHLNGNSKSEGLRELGLVETSEHGGKVRIYLTMLGRLILKGHIGK